MLKHIVMLKLNEVAPEEFQNRLDKMEQMLNALNQTISSLEKMEVGQNISTKASAYDLVLTADFKSEQALDEYRIHPEHIKVLEYIKIWVDKARVVDYWI